FILISAVIAIGQTPQPPFPVKRAESAETWRRDGWNFIADSKNMAPRKGVAKNVILFLGDGMGISTITASRIFEGQLRGESGEENHLSFEDFPYRALSKTYSTNQQTSDSAPTMSAIMTGVKTNEGTLSVDQGTIRGDYRTVAGHETKTLLEYAEEVGKSTGVVSTARVTHATPGACFAHTADRNWESDRDIRDWRPEAYAAKFPDIATQLLNFKFGDGLEVAFSGGRSKFLPSTASDPEYPSIKGERLDGRDLTAEWVKKYKNSAYVWNKKQFDALDPKKVRHALALFEPSYMQFEYDRPKDPAGEPSLSEMTSKAIDILSQNKKGYFLMVEGGRIDMAHHYGNAFRAMTDTIAFSDAVRTAQKKVNLDDTLIIVTADHSHTFFIQGYPVRGNNILGFVRETDERGQLEPDYMRDALGLPYTTLGYANGRGYEGASNILPAGPKLCCAEPRSFSALTRGRFDLTTIDTTNPNYLQEAGIPLKNETHGGEDVAIFATGVDSYLVHGTMEENWIYFVMADAMRLGK
ncbi:MAG TPA: alkaline phosphatase, partial [Pyrinomonadaceae bacterium]|nr:alkaline phosphatase [Pyrinomonadaceae bacterium]